MVAPPSSESIRRGTPTKGDTSAHPSPALMPSRTLPDSLTASARAVGVFVENQDPFRHTFTIAGRGVDVEIPAGTDRRIQLDPAPGTYQFHCTVPGHESMTGTITVG